MKRLILLFFLTTTILTAQTGTITWTKINDVISDSLFKAILKSNNLSDVPNKPLALVNMNLYSRDSVKLLIRDSLVAADIPRNLSDLLSDATHRTVTDSEKAVWNTVSDKMDLPTFNSYSANQTLTSANRFVGVTTSTTDKTITLPVTNISDGTHFYIKKLDSGSGRVAIVVSGGGTIDGAATFYINYQYTSYLFVKYGVNYHIY